MKMLTKCNTGKDATLHGVVRQILAFDARHEFDFLMVSRRIEQTHPFRCDLSFLSTGPGVSVKHDCTHDPPSSSVYLRFGLLRSSRNSSTLS